MFRAIPAVVAATACGLALAVANPSSAAPATKAVQASVGPGFTINVAAGGKTVTKLKCTIAS